MASRKTLEAEIRLFGGVDGSVNQIGSTLESIGRQVSNVGAQISMLSVPIILAGKKVNELYTEFDDAKRWVKAIGNYSDQQMSAIEKTARQYGRDTRYTATEAMNAIGYLEQAGLRIEESMMIYPTLLNMASAGQIDLAESAKLLTNNLYATGTELGQAKEYVDMLAMAANISNTDIDGLGESVIRMGATSRYFAGGNKELLTWLATLGNLGYEGGEAGTHLRNMMLALAAPTDKAAETIEALSASEAEMAAALEDVEATNAADTIRDLKLEIYDGEGRLRSFVDILGDLDRITSTMTEQDRNDVLSKLFPKRTLGAASGLMDLLDIAKDINQQLDNADGTAARMASTREEGIGGTLRMLNSAKEELMLSYGSVLQDTVKDGADFLRGMMLDLAGASDDTKNTVVDVGTGIAILGPTTLLAGKSMEWFGKMLTSLTRPRGAVTLSIAALGMLGYCIARASKRAREADLAEHFGTLSVNVDVFREKLEGMDGGMSQYINGMDKLSAATSGAIENFSDISKTFNGKMLDLVVFKGDLSEQDKTQLRELGQNALEEVLIGINSAQSESESAINYTYGEESEKATELNGIMDQWFGGSIDKAKSIGQQIQQALTAAFNDGKLSGEERENITSYFKEYYALLAEIEGQGRKDELYSSLLKTQNLSGAEYQLAVEEFKRKLQEDYDITMGNAGREAGRMTQAGVSKKEIDNYLADTEEKIKEDQYPIVEAALSLIGASFGEAYDKQLDFLSNTARQSLENYENMMLLSHDFVEDNGMTYYENHNKDADGQIVTGVDRENIINEYERAKKLVSPEQLMEVIGYYQENAKEVPLLLQQAYKAYTGAAALQSQYDDGAAMQALLTADGKMAKLTPSPYDSLVGSDSIFAPFAEKSILSSMDGSEILSGAPGAVEDALSSSALIAQAKGREINDAVHTQWDPAFDIPLFENGNEGIGTGAAGWLSQIEDQIHHIENPLKIITDALDGSGLMAGAPAAAEGNLEAAKGPAEQKAGELMDAVEAMIHDVSFSVKMRLPSLAGLKGLLGGGSGGSGVSTGGKGGGGGAFAEGGRADTASIFGEAGAEWAIPEKHSQRTAELIAAATRASGFSTQEIAERTGGLSANAGHESPIMFSPTIYMGQGADTNEMLERMETMLEDTLRKRDREKRYQYT